MSNAKCPYCAGESDISYLIGPRFHSSDDEAIAVCAHCNRDFKVVIYFDITFASYKMPIKGD